MSEQNIDKDFERGKRASDFVMKNYRGSVFAKPFETVLTNGNHEGLHVEGKDFEGLAISQTILPGRGYVGYAYYTTDTNDQDGRKFKQDGTLDVSVADGNVFHAYSTRIEAKGIVNFINRNNDGREPSGTFPFELFSSGDNWGWLPAIHDAGVRAYVHQKHQRLFAGQMKTIAKPTDIVYLLAIDWGMYDPFAVVWLDWARILNDGILESIAQRVLDDKEHKFSEWSYPTLYEDREFWKTDNTRHKYIIPCRKSNGKMSTVWHVPLEMLIEAAHITVDVRDGQTDQEAEEAILKRLEACKPTYTCDESIMRQRIRYLLDHAEKKIDFTGKNFDRTMLNRK